MTAYLLDTHVWAWDLKQDPMLRKSVLGLIDQSEATYVSVVSFYEIAQKVRLGKWPDMEPIADQMPEALVRQGYKAIDMTGEISQFAGLLDWDHRDPFDRMIAATSIMLKLPLISADTAFDSLSHRKDWPGRIWQ